MVIPDKEWYHAEIPHDLLKNKDNIKYIWSKMKFAFGTLLSDSVSCSDGCYLILDARESFDLWLASQFSFFRVLKDAPLKLTSSISLLSQVWYVELSPL